LGGLAQQEGSKMDLEQLIKDLHKVEEYLHKGFVEMAENEIDYIINDAQAAQQSVQPTGGILPDFLASLTPEQLSALKVLLTPPTSG